MRIEVMSFGMGSEKGFGTGTDKTSSLLSVPTASSTSADLCEAGVKRRCRSRWSDPQSCFKCYDKLHRNCFLSSTCLFFLCSLVIFWGLAQLIAWLALPPFQHEKHLQGVGCRPDNEGSWAIGLYRGTTPFSLRPIESENVLNDAGAAAWPVANPILTCASLTDPGNPSNFVADPFLFLQGSHMYIFFETKNSLMLQGDIGVSRSTDQGATWQYLGIALDEEWHLSYPFIFEYQDQIYMMPEGAKKGDLRLYRATNFPLEWTLEKVLIKKPLVDSSMVEHDGFWYIFASDSTRFGVHKNGELEIWYASAPYGPWKQHRENPVKNSPKHLGARNGGRLFSWEGRLYRPGQDCGDTYGKRLKVFRVVSLSPYSFQEEEVPMGIEEPNWEKGRNAWNGVRHHHLDAHRLPSGDWIAVMDGDRVPSGDRTAKISVGIIALVILVQIICLVGCLLGFVRCIHPFNAFPNCSCARSSTANGRAHLMSATYKRLNRSGGPPRGKVNLRKCLGQCLFAAILAVGVLCIFVFVRCFFGGNDAEEAYALGGEFSQFTMVTMTYDARLWNLKMYVKHYSRCASVREIVVVWNRGQAPDMLELDSAVAVRIRVEPVNSLNNRFKVDPMIRTKAVLELDDDIMMTCDDVERGFKAWREDPDRLVGFYPRLIEASPSLEYRNERHARVGQAYNMILTGAAFINGEKYFGQYWHEANAKGRALVDELFNCEDILMNFVLGNGTDFQGPVQYIHPSWAVDTSKLSNSAISRDTQAHYDKRTVCLQEFSRLFNKVPLTKVKFNNRKDGWDY